MQYDDTENIMSEFAKEFSPDSTEISYENLEALMEKDARLEEADDMVLPDYKMGVSISDTFNG